TRPSPSHGQKSTAAQGETAGMRERDVARLERVVARSSRTRTVVKMASNETAKSGQQYPPPPSDAITVSACMAARSTAPGVIFVGTKRLPSSSAIIEKASDVVAGPKRIPERPARAS